MIPLALFFFLKIVLANQNYKEVSPHTNQNGYHQKIYKQ